MKDKDLEFDRKVHVLYSKPCKKEIIKAIKIHYPNDLIDKIWIDIQLQYVEYLSFLPNNLGGRKNRSNGIGGTYDSIALFSFYKVCKDKTNFKEVETMMENIFLPSFKKLHFVDLNKKFYKKLYYKALKNVKKYRDIYNDYQMELEEYEKDKPIRYYFKTCPVYEFTKNHDLLDILPALCNVDYKGMEVMHSKLIRKCTLKTSSICDYIIVGDQDECIKEHEEYIGDDGGIYNK